MVLRMKHARNAYSGLGADISVDDFDRSNRRRNQLMFRSIVKRQTFIPSSRTRQSLESY